ncbi:MAG: hypothetical protein GX615_09805 [Lentisphaerae bacterium]|jgi:flagellar basal body-associated protein FliL|nr:hypothetical protein [Lentisphaerota bacterium]
MKIILVIIVVVLAAVGVIAWASCSRNGDKPASAEKAGAALDRAAERTGDALNTAAEKTADAAKDAADATKDAAARAARKAGEVIEDAGASLEKTGEGMQK